MNAGGSEGFARFMLQLSPMYIVMLIMAVVFSMPVIKALQARAERNGKYASAMEVCSYAVSLILLLVCIITLSSASYNPFIYFRF